MSLSKPKPVFRVVESVGDDVDYESFKEDFLNPHISVKELIEKQGISKAKYREYREKVCEETGLMQKPVYYIRYHGANQVKMLEDTSYMEKKDNGWIIVKNRNYKSHYYGRYKDLETARMVRNKLIECDWDEKIASELREKYAEKPPRPAYDRAVKLFDEYENLYLNSNFTVTEIIKMMKLTNRTYYHLTQMMREKHGEIHRWRTHD